MRQNKTINASATSAHLALYLMALKVALKAPPPQVVKCGREVHAGRASWDAYLWVCDPFVA